MERSHHTETVESPGNLPMSSDETEEINLSLDTPNGDSSVEIGIKPITVILGTNGTGKSTLLRQLAGTNRRTQGKLESAGVSPVTYVEGGRVANVPNKLRVRDHDSFGKGISESWDGEIEQAKRGELRSRTNKIFDALRRETARRKERHSDKVDEAQREDKVPPERDEPPLDRVFRLFSEIFPSIQLKADSVSNELKAEKYGDSYDASDLSDGEKQVLTLLADLAVHGAGKSVVVDEPELNLNSGLAVRVWETIEQEILSSSDESETEDTFFEEDDEVPYFVYATHSLGFASRSAVDRVIVLDNKAGVATCVDSPSSLLENEAITSEDYLGALTTIVATPTALITEGENGSIDRAFYRWVIGEEWSRKKDGVPVIPLRGSSDVKGAIKQEGIWNEIGENTHLVGVTDRDYLSDSQLKGLKSDNLLILNLHEVESYFCLPKLLCDLAEERVVKKQPTEEDIEEKILEYAESKRVSVATKRVAEEKNITLTVSVTNKDLEEADSAEEVAGLLEQSAEEGLQAAENRLSGSQARDAFETELNQIDDAIENENIVKILKLFPGKELLRRLGHFVGYPSGDTDQILRATRRLLDPSSYRKLEKLRDELRTALED